MLEVHKRKSCGGREEGQHCIPQDLQIGFVARPLAGEGLDSAPSDTSRDGQQSQHKLADEMRILNDTEQRQ